MIIKTRKVDPRAEGGARILIKESDGDVSSLEKSSTDINHPKNDVTNMYFLYYPLWLNPIAIDFHIYFKTHDT